MGYAGSEPCDCSMFDSLPSYNESQGTLAFRLPYAKAVSMFPQILPRLGFSLLACLPSTISSQTSVFFMARTKPPCPVELDSSRSKGFKVVPSLTLSSCITTEQRWLP